MRLAPFALMCVSSVASAQTHYGDVITVRPASATELAGGSLAMWAAGGVGEHGYVGGELSIGNYVTPDDAGISYHVLGGVKSEVTSRVALLVDAGAGVTQQFELHLGLFGGESGADTVGWVPSGAVRAQLVGKLGTVSTTTVGITLHTEARVGLPLDGDVTAGTGLGLGLYLSR